ncbi:MAG: hypothetical protein ACOX88_04680 [Christensenellales bacterium]
MNPIAVIDIGSNCVRLMLARIQDGRLKDVQKFLKITRIAQGAHASGRLAQEAMERTAAVIDDYVQRAKAFSATDIWAYATSAVRDAQNKDAFIRMVKDCTGITADVISGEEESAIAFLGAAQDVTVPTAVIDIGGSSTEISMGRRGKRIFGMSARVGAVRVTELFAASLEAGRPDEALRWIRNVLSPIVLAMPAAPQQIIGVAGTITTVAALELDMYDYDPKRIQNRVLSYDTVCKWVNVLLESTLKERLQMPCMPPGRAEVMPAGALILKAALELLGRRDIIISDRDGLEGYAVKMLPSK